MREAVAVEINGGKKGNPKRRVITVSRRGSVRIGRKKGRETKRVESAGQAKELQKGIQKGSKG